MSTIEQLELEIVSNSSSAISGIDALTQSLTKLKGVTTGKLGLTSVAKELDAFNKVDVWAASAKIKSLADALSKMSKLNLPKNNLSGYIYSLNYVPKAIVGLTNADMTCVNERSMELVDALEPLSKMSKTNLTGYISSLKQLPVVIEKISQLDTNAFKAKMQDIAGALKPISKIATEVKNGTSAMPSALQGLLKMSSLSSSSSKNVSEGLAGSSLASYITPLEKLPKVMESLNKVDMDAVATKMKEVASAVKPLADEMQKVADGFSAMPSKLQKLIKETDKLPTSNQKAAKSFTDLYHKIKLGFNTIKALGNTIGEFITKSNNYVENLNLFNVSMGGYADEAKAYAESLQEVMGIDSSEWMRNQGIFMTLATGFGVASDRAYVMSQNLTQLGYDLSSFFNIGYEEAMQKLQSGLAGELEPLRRLGYDLSQAKLEATALELGLNKSVSAMTQAEKAQLRYYAIMTQVTQVQGDMARTLNAPANQLRVLKAQVNILSREIGNIFIPALNAVLPFLIAITKAASNLARSIAYILGFELPEVDYSGISAMGSVATDTSDALADAEESAKKLKNHMMGFDELNVIDPNSGADDLSGALDFDLPQYDFLEGLAESRADGILESITENLKEIAPKAREAVDAFKDWANINFAESGIDGALESIRSKLVEIVDITNAWFGIGKDSSWDGVADDVSNSIGEIGRVVSIAPLAIGALLTFSGASPGLGLALMAVGATSLASSLLLGWDVIPENIKSTIGTIVGVIATGMFAIGAVLALSGANIPLGIALLAGGAMMYASAIVPNWDELPNSVKETLSVINIAVGTGLALGAILAFSAGNIPLGIGLMAAGATMLGTTIALNWNAIVDNVKGTNGLILGALSTGLLVLGGILTFSGAFIPLGIGLMAAGAAGLATAIGVNWDAIVGVFKSIINNLNTILSGAFLAVGFLMLLNPATMGLGLALIFAGLQAGYTALQTDSNPIVSFVKDMINGIIDAINSGLKKINSAFASIGLGSISFNLIPKFADGGFPTEGQMFIAREAGAEMVGNIGRRTAVANNDQIVGGIASGVATANEEQNALLREQNSLLRSILEKDSGVYLDGKNLANSVEKYQRERGRVLVTGGVL